MDGVFIMYSKHFRPWETAALLALCLTLLSGAWATSRQQHLASDLIRLHVLAVSDEEAEQALKKRDQEYTAEVAAACQLLDQLPPLECSVMSRFYVRGQSLRSIAADMGYSYSYVRGLKSEGCRKLGGIGEGVVLGLLPHWYIIEDEKRQR